MDDSHILKKVDKYKLTLRHFRRDDPLIDSHWSIRIGLRGIYKILRTYYVSISYYFMPFTMMVLNIKYMAEGAVYFTEETREQAEREARKEREVH